MKTNNRGPWARIWGNPSIKLLLHRQNLRKNYCHLDQILYVTHNDSQQMSCVPYKEGVTAHTLLLGLLEVLSVIHMQSNKCLCLHVAIQTFYYFSQLTGFIYIRAKATSLPIGCIVSLSVCLYYSDSSSDKDQRKKSLSLSL